MKVLIVGGGLSGLGAGYRLSKQGFEVTILEKEEYIGGMASSYLIDGIYVPKTYHHIMSGDKVTLSLIRELGLQPYLYWKRLKTGFLYGNNQYDFSSPVSILRFKPLSIIDRIKFALLVLKARTAKDWAFLDGVNIKDWVSENYGEGLYQNLIKHIVIDKFDEPPENISAAWLLSRFGHESKSISGKFGYLRDKGIQELIDRLSENIKRNGGTVKKQARVKRVSIEDEQVTGVVYGEDKRFEEGDAVISTVPTPIVIEIVPELPESYKQQLRHITYKACICMTIGLEEKISEYYWLNCIGSYPFVGLFEHRYLNIDATPEGIMYLVKYLDTTHTDWLRSNEEIMERYIFSLEESFPGVKSKILWYKVYREPFSTPVYSVNFGKFMPDLLSPIKNLYITGISRIYPKDRYMGTALASGFEAAEAMIKTC
ncbi:MAG: FAD-dependent oxidoreductase [Candidatus Bathyarchaeota archaeon]|nr:MAG: FAD-dependent oxidoreductase [Candidatus Bathyarchaeota archaeon]